MGEGRGSGRAPRTPQALPPPPRASIMLQSGSLKKIWGEDKGGRAWKAGAARSSVALDPLSPFSSHLRDQGAALHHLLPHPGDAQGGEAGFHGGEVIGLKRKKGKRRTQRAAARAGRAPGGRVHAPPLDPTLPLAASVACA